MTRSFILPFAALALLTLTACENRGTAPDMPDPDAGAPPAEPAEGMGATNDDDVPLTTPEEAQRTREDIERQAQETFETIVEQTDSASEVMSSTGSDFMRAISDEMDAAGDSLEDQLAAIQRGVVNLRDDNLTLPEKLEIVANARTTAQEAARALGRPDNEVAAAGSQAESAAREALDL